MLLERILESLVRDVPGAISAILADWEGESVVHHAGPGIEDYEIKFVGAHHGIILSKARELMSRLELGNATQLSFVQEKFNVVTAPVNDDYYLVLTLLPKSLPIFAKPAVSRAIKEIEADIG